MASIPAIATTIRTEFATGFAAARPGMPWIRQNERYEPDPTVTWARLSIIQGQSEQIAFGNVSRTWRHRGRAIVQVFVPIGKGDGTALEIARDAGAIFQGKTLSGVLFGAASIASVGKDGAFYQVNASIPFWSDETL